MRSIEYDVLFAEFYSGSKVSSTNIEVLCNDVIESCSKKLGVVSAFRE
jgi:hypothetical protein